MLFQVRCDEFILTLVGLDEMSFAGDLAPGAVLPVALEMLYIPAAELPTYATAAVPEWLVLMTMLYSTSGLTTALSVYASTSFSTTCSLD